jgi:hypothetical protein
VKKKEALMRALLCFGLVVPLTACSAEGLGDEAGSAELALDDADPIAAFYRSRAALYRANDSECTATRIASRYFITAAHCNPKTVGSAVVTVPGFVPYDPNNDDDYYFPIEAVGMRPGVDPATEDWSDDANEWFADIAILRTSTAPYLGADATLAWVYPGAHAPGVKIGAGLHDGVNAFGTLKQKNDETFSDVDSEARFRTVECASNPGDSGGAFYHDHRLLGVTSGCTLVDNQAKYTSVPRHLDWILDVIDYVWPGGAVKPLRRTGEVIQTFGGSLERCQYACDRTSACKAFSRRKATKQCTLLSSVGGVTDADAYQSALK